MNRTSPIAALLLLIASSTLASRAGAQAWFDSHWLYRRPVTLSSPGESALANFQVLVTLTDSLAFTRAKSDGSDLRVTAGDGITPVSFWIESWDPAASRAKIWVKAPEIPPAGTSLYLYYGNGAVSGASSGDSTFDFFDGFDSRTTLGYYSLGKAQTVLVQDQAWETSAPHTLSVVQAPSGAAVPYYGYYGLQGCGGIGMAGSSDLVHWTKFATNPLLSGSGERWPTVALAGGTYSMVHDVDFCGTSSLVLRTSTNGLSWSNPSTLVAAVSGERNQNADLFRDPASGQFYLYWYRGDDHTSWRIMARHATTVAALASAPETPLLSATATLAAPNMMYRDNTYFLATEVLEGVWKTRIDSSPSPNGPFTALPGNPVMTGGSACVFQTPIGDELYCFFCKLTSGVWTLNLSVADLSAGRAQVGVLDAGKWSAFGGDWTGPVAAQQGGATGVVAQGSTSSVQVFKSKFSGGDYVVESYGRQLAGRVWGLGLRTTDAQNTYSLNLYEDLDGSNNLYLFRWAGGGATSVWKTALGPVDPNTWYKLTARVHGNSFDIAFNDVPKTSTSVLDSRFASGSVALYGEANTTAQFNDVRVRQYAATEPAATVGAETLRPPMIDRVATALATDGTTATITWATDEPATSQVVYGTSPSSLGSSASSGTLVFAHNVALGSLNPTAIYYFRVTSADATGDAAQFPALPAPPLSFTTPHVTAVETPAYPLQAVLAPCYPDPSSGMTTVMFGVPREAFVNLTVFDLQGRAVKRLSAGIARAGWTRVPWDGRDDTGNLLSPGVYVVRLITEGQRVTQSIRRVR